MPDYQETIVRIDYTDKYAEVWTERRGLKARLKRLGFAETKAQDQGVWYRGAIRQISFRNAARKRHSGTTRPHFGRPPDPTSSSSPSVVIPGRRLSSVVLNEDSTPHRRPSK